MFFMSYRKSVKVETLISYKKFVKVEILISYKKLTKWTLKEKNKAHTKTAPVYAVKNTPLLS